MTLNFTKMHGCGNDYIYFDFFKHNVPGLEDFSVRLSDRHKGIGGDGIVLICPSETADAEMRMFNADGSEGKMCGNAVRCVAKYIYDNGYVKSDTVDIETLSGIKNIKLKIKDGTVCAATVNMGAPVLDPEKIPVLLNGESVINRKINVAGGEYAVTCISMGNPHCVVFCGDISSLDIERIGPMFENADIFPERINTEFVEIADSKALKMRVWERGSGETQACGTGACAAAVAAVVNGFCQMNSDIRVSLLGGELVIRYTHNGVFMTGEAKKVFEGTIEL